MFNNFLLLLLFFALASSEFDFTDINNEVSDPKFEVNRLEVDEFGLRVLPVSPCIKALNNTDNHGCKTRPAHLLAENQKCCQPKDPLNGAKCVNLRDSVDGVCVCYKKMAKMATYFCTNDEF